MEIHGGCGLREDTQATDKFTACQPPCPVCELCGTLQDLKICAGCKTAWYCSKDHQRSHWPVHKSKCKKSQICACDNQSKPQGEEAPVTVGTTGLSSDIIYDGNKLSTSKQSSEVTISSTDSTATSGTYVSDKENNNAVINTTADISWVEEGAVGGCIPTTASQANPNKHNIAEMTLKKLDAAAGSKKSAAFKTGVSSCKKGRSSIYKHSHRHGSGAGPPAASGLAALATETVAPEADKSNEGLSDYVVKCLTEYGICVVDQFLGEVRGSAILDEVVRVREAGCLMKGQLIANLGTQRKVRGDEITWVEKGDNGRENTSFLIARLDSLLLACNSKLHKHEIGGRTKAMVACYPGNATYYLRHVDNPNGDGRLITCIYYLNKDWDVKTDGGILRIFPESVKNSWVADIEPKFDRLLFFWSDRRNPHEVQAAYKTRFAITVWYFDKAERQQALIKHQGSVGQAVKKQKMRIARFLRLWRRRAR